MTDNSRQPDACKIDIVESYKHYAPPIRVRAVVERLVARMPDRYKWGLKTIVLTDSASISRNERNRKVRRNGKRYLKSECLGMYFQKWKGEPAWIRLIIDNILKDCPWYVSRIPIVQDIVIGQVLYHELGHHIHATSKPEYKDKEDVADRWSGKLMVAYMRKQYWYLTPIFVTVAHIMKFFRRIRAKFKRYKT
ncbi:MAG: hypothetical protein DHS20C16_30500 [Phycisphaerae bacterium]|nr:MAG: hypothetical protein DHS20C16_30500 [Phycisphaerae bacterium]